MYSGQNATSCNITHVENVIYYTINFYKNNVRGAYIWFFTHDYEDVIFADGSRVLVRIWSANNVFSIESIIPDTTPVYFRFISAINFGPV